MVMRISENIKFSTIVDNMFKSQDSYNKLAEKVASQKDINRPSDDPIGMNSVLNLRESKASVEQYTRNMNGCESWLTITESKLSAAGDLLIKAREVAVAQSTATASAEMRSAEAGTVQQLIDEMLTLANSKYEGRHLFSGGKTGEEPFSSSVGAATIGTASAADGNTFDGDVTSSGTYTGSVNKTYVVKITDWDNVTETATYDVSDDGGASWISTGETFVLLNDGEVSIGDGINLTFKDTGAADPELADGDIFYVHALAAGYYNGNGEELSINIGEGTPFAYSISGEAAFTDNGEGSVDVFGTLNELKTALDNNDADGIASCLDGLKDASDQISKNISRCGARVNRLEVAKNNMADMEMDLTGLISNVEDADISEIITKLAMKEIVLRASYSVASKIGNLTLLDFLR
ncbi:MAG: flagellar hook-associated protein FlgL [Spirochaetales bacterium]|jgi:flagellar hook-associated protein 3 FlgL|nr:flagellar hook-associated protein FlgL [Spirochaetales bacterium]